MVFILSYFVMFDIDLINEIICEIIYFLVKKWVIF